MYLKALDIPRNEFDHPLLDPVCEATAPGTFDHAVRAAEDPYLDLAVELLTRRGAFSDADAREVAQRVRRGHALAAWRGLAS